MTDAERKLWFRIRNNQLGVKFRRQQPIGNYIADFICFEKKLVIEIDGGEHLENKRDEARDKWFRKQRFQILRFWNNEVLANLEGVLKIIKEKLSPSPLILSHQEAVPKLFFVIASTRRVRGNLRTFNTL